VNSETLYAEEERRGPARRGPYRGSAAGVERPLQAPCKGRGLAGGNRCSQPKLLSQAANSGERAGGDWIWTQGFQFHLCCVESVEAGALEAYRAWQPWA
jgi:hypothetical protein